MVLTYAIAIKDFLNQVAENYNGTRAHHIYPIRAFRSSFDNHLKTNIRHNLLMGC